MRGVPPKVDPYLKTLIVDLEHKHGVKIKFDLRDYGLSVALKVAYMGKVISTHTIELVGVGIGHWKAQAEYLDRAIEEEVKSFLYERRASMASVQNQWPQWQPIYAPSLAMGSSSVPQLTIEAPPKTKAKSFYDQLKAEIDGRLEGVLALA